MVAWDTDHYAAGTVGRHPEWVGLALDDEHRDGDGVELREPALRRIVPLAGRMDREREAEHRDRLRLGRGPAGHPGTGRAPAGDEGQSLERLGAQVGDDHEPRGIELAGRGRAAATSHQVGLFHQGDANALVVRGSRCRDEVRGADAPAGSVAEDERAAWIIDGVQMRSRSPMWRLDLDHGPMNCHGATTKSAQMRLDPSIHPSYRRGQPMAATKKKGDLAELKVACDLVERGYQVAIPFGEDADFDLLARCSSSSLTNGKVKRIKRYTGETIDLLAVYDPTTDACYYVPAEELGWGRRQLVLRISDPRNNQRQRIRFANEYLSPRLAVNATA